MRGKYSGRRPFKRSGRRTTTPWIFGSWEERRQWGSLITTLSMFGWNTISILLTGIGVSLGKPNMEIWPALSLNRVCYFRSINEETEFCIRTPEKTNRCQRLAYRIIADNEKRKLVICPEVVDGKWSNWTDLGRCEGLQEVEGVANYTCGLGYKQRQRNCARTLGGKFCQLDGKDYKGRIEKSLVRCNSVDCPGELHTP